MATGHSGISHPFGAPHDAASGGASEAWGASTETEIERNIREYVRWVPAGAPLHDRMYPNEFNADDQPSRVVDDYMRRRLSAGVNADPVGTHSRMRHMDIYPYKPDPGAPRMYYHLGVRPLDGVLKFFHRHKYLNREQHMEHMQFVANNGDNFGMLKNGFFSDAAVGADATDNMARYKVLRKKYSARLIDEARRQLDEEWTQAERRHWRETLDSGTLHPQAMRRRYHLYLNNCQDYIKQVVDRAATLATPGNPLVLN